MCNVVVVKNYGGRTGGNGQCPSLANPVSANNLTFTRTLVNYPDHIPNCIIAAEYLLGFYFCQADCSVLLSNTNHGFLS